jgi:seryl-tRNA synthetase
MLELRFLRENLALVREKTARRGKGSQLVDSFAATDSRRLDLLAEVEGLKNTRNTVSDQIAALKKNQREAEAEPLIAAMRQTSQRIKDLDGELHQVEEELAQIVMAIPKPLRRQRAAGQ